MQLPSPAAAANVLVTASIAALIAAIVLLPAPVNMGSLFGLAAFLIVLAALYLLHRDGSWLLGATFVSVCVGVATGSIVAIAAPASVGTLTAADMRFGGIILFVLSVLMAIQPARELWRLFALRKTAAGPKQ